MATDYICMIYVCCFVTHAYTQRSNMLLNKEIQMQRPNKLHNKTQQPVEDKIQMQRPNTLDTIFYYPTNSGHECCAAVPIRDTAESLVAGPCRGCGETT